MNVLMVAFAFPKMKPFSFLLLFVVLLALESMRIFMTIKYTHSH
jgi:hypothetical protein